MKKITFLVSSCNREKYVEKLINSVGEHKDISIIVIDDFSKIKYKLDKKKNLILIRNKENLHKFRSFLKVRKKIDSRFICFIDDKDFFIEGSIKKILAKLNNMSDDNILVLDMYNNKKVIGKKYRSTSLREHKNFKCDFGDKLLFIPFKYYDQYKFNIESLKIEKIYNNDLFIEEILDIKTEYLDDYLVEHPYLEGGITENNLSNKIKNFIYRSELLKIQLVSKSSIKYKVYKLFERWIIRDKIYVPLKNGILKIINLILYLSFSYYIILYVYKKKLKKIIKG